MYMVCFWIVFVKQQKKRFGQPSWKSKDKSQILFAPNWGEKPSTQEGFVFMQRHVNRLSFDFYLSKDDESY